MRAAVAILPRPGGLIRLVAEALRGARAPSTRLKRGALIAAVLALALAAAYWFWFRDSSFVRVERVTVSGLSGTDAPRERRGVIAAAKEMTTLDYDEAALRRALGAGATIEALHARPDFPHGLRIEVVEKTAVAVLDGGSERVAVGSGGVLLPDVRPIPRGLPSIAVGALPSTRLGEGRALRLVAAAAAAPAALRARITSLRELPAKGLVAFLRSGPDVILGGPTDLSAKWMAAAAILADPDSRGASYIDVRLPDRPVAGGLEVAPLPAADQPTATPAQSVQPAAAGASGTVPAQPATPAARPTTGQAAAAPTSATPAPAQQTSAPATGTGGTAAGTGP